MSLIHEDRQHLLNFIKSLDIKASTGFKNFVSTVELPNALVLDIGDVQSLQAILAEIYKLNQTKSASKRILVRAAAGNSEKNHQSYSLSQIVAGDVILRLTGKPFQFIEQTNDPHIMRVGASVQIGQLDEILYNNFNLALPTSSLIPYVTVAGLAATAGHGTGIEQPAFTGLIQSITLCLPNGKIIRVDENNPYFETIRGAHLGVFGIIIDMELRCVEAKKIQCVMEARSIPEFIEEIKSGLFKKDDYVSAMYVPTYQPDELTNRKLKNVIVYRFRPVEKSVNDVNFHPNRAKLVQELEIKMHEDLHIADLLRAFPSLTPYYMKYLVSKTNVGKYDSLFVAPWSGFHYQTVFPRQIRDADYLFETDDEGKKVIDALETLVKRIQAHAEKKEYPIDYGAYIRIFKGTNGGLSTSDHQANKLTCGFDIVSSPKMKGWDKLNAFLDYYFLHDLQAKMHWGKNQSDKINYAQMYGPRYQQFINALNNWYKDQGMELQQSMLVNGFLARVLGQQAAYANDPILGSKDLPQRKPEEVADAILEHVEGDDVYANLFREKLQAIRLECCNTKKRKVGFFRNHCMADAAADCFDKILKKKSCI